MKMYVCKAEPITPEEEIENAELHIKKRLPEFKQAALSEMEEFYNNDAKDIYDVLKQHLPQATMHYLLILMLQDKQNLYRGI